MYFHHRYIRNLVVPQGAAVLIAHNALCAMRVGEPAGPVCGRHSLRALHDARGRTSNMWSTFAAPFSQCMRMRACIVWLCVSLVVISCSKMVCDVPKNWAQLRAIARFHEARQPYAAAGNCFNLSCHRDCFTPPTAECSAVAIREAGAPWRSRCLPCVTQFVVRSQVQVACCRRCRASTSSASTRQIWPCIYTATPP